MPLKKKLRIFLPIAPKKDIPLTQPLSQYFPNHLPLPFSVKRAKLASSLSPSLPLPRYRESLSPSLSLAVQSCSHVIGRARAGARPAARYVRQMKYLTNKTNETCASKRTDGQPASSDLHAKAGFSRVCFSERGSVCVCALCLSRLAGRRSVGPFGYWDEG